MALNCLRWVFPLPRTHTGALLGNGRLGLMVWGDRALSITLGHAGFWDHRGGNDFAGRITYRELAALLKAGDEPALRARFARPDRQAGEPDRPTQIGLGRVELHLPGTWRPRQATLEIEHARLVVQLAEDGGHTAELTIEQAMDSDLAWIELPEPVAGATRIELTPTWDYVGTYLASVGCQPPERFQSDAHHLMGLVQHLPDDLPGAFAVSRTGNRILMATAVEPDPVSGLQNRLLHAEPHAARTSAQIWWRQYWRDVPAICLDDPELQEIVDYGLYKQAGLHTPGKVPASLQGPWLEEYQLPPWSCDYHFNINVQMAYWPVLATNRLEHLNPLWNMIRSWWPTLQANARRFFEAEHALMLPHAVDDRCQAVGAFWTGMIDHACTAWMAQLAWLHYRYSMDQAILRDIAHPMLVGAFEGYWAMLEQPPDGRLRLPVSVSPEFRGSRMDAWGPNASFQLAAAHFVAQTLQEAAKLLSLPPDPRWAQLRDRLPLYSTTDKPFGERGRGTYIALWEDQPLCFSHRHHSHLAAIYPFATIDPFDPAHEPIVRNSLQQWVDTGPGAWSGWCVPWAAILNARCNRADAAVAWLHWWKRVFTNQGRGTLHDAAFPGCTVLADAGDHSVGSISARSHEVMQIEAGMGALNAVLELLVQCRGPLIRVCPSVPTGWRHVSWRNILAEGAFLVSADIQHGRLASVRVEAQVDGLLTLEHGLGTGCVVDGVRREGAVLVQTMQAGQQLSLTRADG